MKKESQIFLSLLFLADLLILAFSWNLAYQTRFALFNYPFAISIPPRPTYLWATIVVLPVGAVSFVYARMYERSQVLRWGRELRALLKGMVLLFILLLGSSFFYRSFSFSRVHALHFMIIAFVLLWGERRLVRAWQVQQRKAGKNLRKVLVVGAGQTAGKFVQKIRENEALGLSLLGYVAPQANPALDLPHLGDVQALEQVITELGVEEVFIALDTAEKVDLAALYHRLAEQVVDLNVVPDIYHTLMVNPEILDLEGMPLITLRQSPVGGWNRVAKRIFDLLGSLTAILLLTPVWLVLPLLIKITSPGPVFYRQTRMGLDGKSFEMLKFRSMRVDAEAKTGAVWATKDDNRRTRLGSFMRKTSLDELPQFFNVLEGSMSIVGPRPERPVFIEEFKHQIPNYMLRHKMKAGITGWAQINGWRGNTSLEKRIEYDIYYLTNWSIWFDIKILFISFFKGFIDPNAY